MFGSKSTFVNCAFFLPLNFPNEIEFLNALILTRLNSEAGGWHQWAGLGWAGGWSLDYPDRKFVA